MEEEVNKQSKTAENERSNRLEATWTLKTSKDDLAKAKVALTEAIWGRDSASASLVGAKKKAKNQSLPDCLKEKDSSSEHGLILYEQHD